MDEAIFGKYNLKQSIFYLRHIPLLSRPLFPEFVYSRCLINIQESELLIPGWEKAALGLRWATEGGEMVAHACEDPAHYLKSSLQGTKSHQGQLLGVTRKSSYEMIPLG